MTSPSPLPSCCPVRMVAARVVWIGLGERLQPSTASVLASVGEASTIRLRLSADGSSSLSMESSFELLGSRLARRLRLGSSFISLCSCMARSRSTSD